VRSQAGLVSNNFVYFVVCVFFAATPEKQKAKSRSNGLSSPL
jgi:hypothetical protein